MRVQKIISMAGICSRRKAEDWIKQGRVTVNGKIVLIGQSADIDKDIICVDNKRISKITKKYYAFYKPKGYLSSLVSHFDKKPISVFFPEKVFSVGRLDFMTEGLMLLTNDGDFANLVMHPRYEVEKEYQVVLEKPITTEVINQIDGVVIDGKKVSVKVISKTKTMVHIILHEGRKHIVRRIFEAVGCRVVNLLRVRIGKVTLGDLTPGKYRVLSKQEIESFQKYL